MATVDWSLLKPIPQFTGVDASLFHSRILSRNEPAVLKGLASSWPSVAAASESNRAFCDYLGGFDAKHPVNAFFADAGIGGRFFYSDDLKGFNFERRQLPLSVLLDALLEHVDDATPPCIYAGAIPLIDKLAPVGQQNAHGLLPPGTEQLVSLWLGNQARTAAHWDLAQNIACVLAGRRRFTLFPPDQLPDLYIGPLDFTLAGQPVSLVDFLAVDEQRFPRFRRALDHASVALLEPGDGLYIPAMWFHHVESLDRFGALLNTWWRDAEPYMFTPLYTLLHGLLSIRDMPEAERRAWRGMFDHYIFRLDQEPFEHVPQDARGYFGEMTAERVARLRALLIGALGGKTG